MLECLLAFLKTYQIFIAALLGFTGVILTLLGNAKIQRGVQRTQLEHERNSIRVAMKTELVKNQESYESRISQLNDTSKNSSCLVPTKVMNHVYRELLPSIGLLTEEEISKVIGAHLLIEELPYRLRLLVGQYSSDSKDESIVVDSVKQKDASLIHNAILPEIKNAINSIELELRSSHNK